MRERLRQFLSLVKDGSFNSGDVPKVWNEQYRTAISDGLINIGFGGRLKVSDRGTKVLNSTE